MSAAALPAALPIALPIALAALFPVLIGPVPAESGAITAALCNGGTITIPLGDKDTPTDNDNCHPKGCHAGNCREKDRQERGKRRI